MASSFRRSRTTVQVWTLAGFTFLASALSCGSDRSAGPNDNATLGDSLVPPVPAPPAPVDSQAPSPDPGVPPPAPAPPPDPVPPTPVDTVVTDTLPPCDFVQAAAYSGIPFGPFHEEDQYIDPPFTMSQNYVDPLGIVRFINCARLNRQRLILAMAGGLASNYTTDGKFDMAKFTRRMDGFRTDSIRIAVAAGVADGTIIGNMLIDEPETPRWGGVITKQTVDEMAAYVKAIFPTLPQGVNHGPTGYYLWRTNERYRVVDYVMNNYVWWITTGDVGAWREKLLAQARMDGVRVGFGINVLDGGIKKVPRCFGGTECCPVPETGGLGTYAGPGGQNCRMTADQVRTWGQTLGVAGCALLVWKYDGAFMTKPENQQAFKDVAAKLASTSGPPCRRS